MVTRADRPTDDTPEANDPNDRRFADVADQLAAWQGAATKPPRSRRRCPGPPRAWPSTRAASRSASTSQWAVGSLRSSRSFGAAAITSPSWAITQPTGTSSCSKDRSASRNARRMKYSSRGKNRGVMLPSARAFSYRPELLMPMGYSFAVAAVHSELTVAQCA